MLKKIEDAIRVMEEFAPSELALSWDNTGLLVGDEKGSLTKILCALDCTDGVIREAAEKGAELIITHHPLIFRSINHVRSADPVGGKIIKLIRNGISLYAAHTNLDKTKGGTNDVLANALCLQDIESLFGEDSENRGMGRTGELPKETTLKELSAQIKQKLGLEHLQYVGNSATPIQRIALCTGSASGKDFFEQAIRRGCQVYITGDIRFHDAQLASDMGLCLIDATHYGSEVIAVKALCRVLREKSIGTQVEIIESQTDGQVLKIY